MKKIIITLGNRGNLGKTVFLSFLADYFAQSFGEENIDEKIKLYDGDYTSLAFMSQMSNKYKCEKLGVKDNRLDIDKVISDFDENSNLEYAFIDSVGTGYKELLNWFKLYFGNSNQEQTFNELKALEVEFCFVLTACNDKQSLLMINHALGVFGANVNWIVVKNDYTAKFKDEDEEDEFCFSMDDNKPIASDNKATKSNKFQYFDSSKIAKILKSKELERNVFEIAFPYIDVRLPFNKKITKNFCLADVFNKYQKAGAKDEDFLILCLENKLTLLDGIDKVKKMKDINLDASKSRIFYLSEKLKNLEEDYKALCDFLKI